MFVCAWVVAPKTDVETEPSADPRPITSSLKAVLSDESASARDAAAELRASEACDTEILRALISAEIPVLMAASAAPNDAAAVLLADMREEASDSRLITSSLKTVLSNESASARDAAPELRANEVCDT